MNKTKYVLAGFAMFAAMIMLMTPCMARPIAERASIDAVEQPNEEINIIMQSLSSDRRVMQALRLIEQAETEVEFEAGVEQLGFALESNPDFAQLLYIVNGDSPNDVDSDEAQWPGFMRNFNGDIYVPGVGWISPDDPAYDDYLGLEDLLQGLGLSPGDILIIIGLIIYFSAFGWFALGAWLIANGYDFDDDIWLAIFMILGYGGAFLVVLGEYLNDQEFKP